MKIFSSNFTDRLTTGTIIEIKSKIRSKGVVKGSCDLVFEFWDPLYISEMVEARNESHPQTFTLISDNWMM